jgi:hypothetical protein
MALTVSKHLISLFYTSVTGASKSGNGQLRGPIACDSVPPPGFYPAGTSGSELDDQGPAQTFDLTTAG